MHVDKAKYPVMEMAKGRLGLVTARGHAEKAAWEPAQPESIEETTNQGKLPSC